MKKIFSKQFWEKIRGFRINRKYKDRLFRFIFQDKKDLLDLYNAINGTEYTDQEELVITTLEDVVYLGFKNDLSFLIGCELNLYEHQSSWNPNMPLRGLFYFSDMLRGYVESNDLDLYSSARLWLPIPRYIIFYNGAEEQPDRMVLRLSDSFESRNAACGTEETVLECCATMLNINYGHNQEIMKRCKRLSDYAFFVQAVRKYLDKGNDIRISVDLAVDECINKGILEDVLRKNRAEVKEMLLTVYNEKQHNRTLREEGREEGRSRVNELNRRLLDDGREADLRRAVTDSVYQEQLMKEYGL